MMEFQAVSSGPILRDLHVHTRYSDGRDTPEEMVLAAISRGIEVLGFSDHGYSAADPDCCIPKASIQAYREEVLALKEKYADRIHILLGVEKDFTSTEDTSGYEYVIGSVHYAETPCGYVSVDNTPEILLEAVRACFGGDPYALCEAYFDAAGRVFEKTNCDIIGHFDLVSKFNETGRLFDETHPRYRNAWQAAAERLLRAGKPFEINTGAISRGYRSSPYPSPEILAYLKDRDARFILSSDCHAKENLLFGFERWRGIAGDALTEAAP